MTEAGSCGARLLFVLALVCCRRVTLKLLVLNYAFTIPHITLPLDDKCIKQTSIMHTCIHAYAHAHTYHCKILITVILVSCLFSWIFNLA